jgi:adenylate cyclase
MSLKIGKVLLIDDGNLLWDAVHAILREDGYGVSVAESADEALSSLDREFPDLIILGLEATGIDRFEVCRRLKQRCSAIFLPIIVITSDGADSEDQVRGLEIGSYDFLPLPLGARELRAKAASFLKMKRLYDTVESQRVRLAALNERQENIIQEQQAKVVSLRRFFSPQVADLILAAADPDVVSPHKQDVTICFVDLRGFTAFAEITEPAAVIRIIQEYYRVVCSIALSYGGTISSLAGDGIMVFFNDPVPVKRHTEAAVNFLFEVRGELNERSNHWQRMGYALGFGAGMARGESIVGAIGFERFVHYTAISATVNLAARLCKEAQVGQVLGTLRGLRDVEGRVELEPAGVMNLKGVDVPVSAMNLLHWKSASLAKSGR